MFRMLMATLLTFLMGLSNAWAQAYPTHPVRIVVGFGTGGPDTTARLLATQLTTQMGQAFVVDNRPGATGTIGAAIVAKAAPDGYTLMIAPNSLTSAPYLYKTLPFDLLKDFIPISHTSSSEAAFLVVNPSVPVKSLKELVAYTRNPANKVSYGSPGIGSGLHLRNALFRAKSGANMVHVPYKGAGPAITGLLGGEVQVMFVTVTAALPLIKSGRLRALAYDYPTRADVMPDIPTMAEAGAPATQLGSGWHGMFAPAKTPAAIITKLEGEVRKVLARPEVRQQFANLGLIPVGSTSAEFRKTVAETMKAMGEAVKIAGIEAE